jgi:glyoxylase-like metal-dependent hydrolase (beta-lactamase superfamily II)
MQLAVDMTRRTFLVNAGQGSIALAVLSVAGCAPTAIASSQPSRATSTDAPEPASPGASASASAGASDGASDRPSGSGSGVAWQRANLGFVSAYVLARAGEAAIVDTGVAGSEDAIGDALDAAGLGWDAVGHVILTHRHGDHAGSIDAVLAKAPGANAYAGAEDIPRITALKPITSVTDGDLVFGLRIVATPGHTLGHVAVLDEIGGLLVAGDALRTTGGTLGGSLPDFTEDAALAKASYTKLGALQYETLLVGHGEPILDGAAAQVAAFAAAA